MSEEGSNELSRGEDPHLAYIPLQWTTGDEPDQDSHVREYREYKAYRRDVARSYSLDALNAIRIQHPNARPRPNFWTSLLGSPPF